MVTILSLSSRSLLASTILASSLVLGPQPVWAAAGAATLEVAEAVSPSLPPEAVATYIDAEGLRFALIAAGEVSATRDAVVEELGSALVNCGKGVSVFDASSAGDLSGLDDQSIAARLKAYPVDRVAVVRVFPGVGDDPATTVISILKTDGEVTAGVSLAGSAPLSANPAASGPADSGLSSDTVNAVSSEVQAAEDVSADAVRSYNRDKLAFQNWIGVRANTGAVVARWIVPVQGDAQVPLGWADFYKTVGRDDLARKYKNRRIAKLSLLIGGPVVGAGLALGGVFLFTSSITGGDGDPFMMEEASSDDGARTAGIALMVTGGVIALGSLVAGAFIKLHVVKTGDVVRMVEDHNAGLRKRLGLPADLARRGLDVGPTLVRGGGGLSVAGRF